MLISDAIFNSCLLNQGINQYNMAQYNLKDPNLRQGVDLQQSAIGTDVDMINESSGGGGAGPKDIFEYYDKLDQDEGVDMNAKGKCFSFEIVKAEIEKLQKRYCFAGSLASGHHLLMEIKKKFSFFFCQIDV